MMNKVYHWKELKFIVEGLESTIEKLEKLEQKIDNLPHPAVLGDSLLKIKDKFEVVKLKNKLGNEKMTFDGLKTLFDKYNKTLDTFDEEISKIQRKLIDKYDRILAEINHAIEKIYQKKLPIYDQWFKFNSVKFLTTAFKDNTVNYFLHTDGEFSFHYWQNPSLITTYKKPEDYTFTQLFGINQNPAITSWSPYIEYDFNANTGEVDFKLASYKKTGAGWIQKTWMVIKTEENDTTFDFKKNLLTFKFKEKSYDVQNLLDKIHDRPSHKEVVFNKVILKIPRYVAMKDENGKVLRDKKGNIKKKHNPNIIEANNVVEIHNYSELIRNTKFVGKTLQFQFVRCAGDENDLHGDEFQYTVYSAIFEADKLPALDTSTWTKIYKMDSRIQWFLGNRGEIKTEHWDDCVKGAPTIQLKLESTGYYLRFVWDGFMRWWTGKYVNFSTKSYWDTFKIVADVYK